MHTAGQEQERVGAPARPTLEHVARRAGVSLATVDRVLNERPGVRARTRERVLEAARGLGYIAAPPAAGVTQPELRDITLDIVLPDGRNEFIRLFALHLRDLASQRPGLGLRLHMIDGFNPASLADLLGRVAAGSDGIGITALDHPLVREAIRGLARTVPVATLISDITQVARVGFIGIDNRAAGRLAGQLLGRFLPGRGGQVALFAGSLSYRAHEEREMGFRHILREEHARLAVVALREMADDPERAYGEARALLANYPDLAGIYNIGGGNEGIGRALEESGRGGEVVFIGHELTDEARGLLLRGTMDAAIDQNPRVEARETLEILSRAARGERVPPTRALRMHAIFRENLPD